MGSSIKIIKKLRKKHHMRYEKINPIQQFNFQINRILTYGEIAADVNTVRKKQQRYVLLMNGKMYGATWENWLNKNQNFSGLLIAFVWQNFF